MELLKVRLVTLHLPDLYVDNIEALIDKGVYPNRSEVIRLAVRDLLKNELGTLDFVPKK